LQRQLMLSFTLFTLGVSALLGLFAMALVYSVEDRFIAATLSRAATQMQSEHQASGRWPPPPQAFMQRYETAADLPADLRLAWQAEPHRREFRGTQGRHYHLHWLGRPQGAPPDPPLPDARHPVLVAEVSGLLVVRPVRRELLVWWATGSGGLTLAALALAAWRARRISAPLVRLADAIARMQPEDGATRSTPYAAGNRDDEVGLLARHLDALTARTQSFVDRERAFTRDVSHELRTPLAVLGMASERLLGRHELPADVMAQLQHMRDGLWDMEQTVNALLVMAREAHAPAGADAMADAMVDRVTAPRRPAGSAPDSAPASLAVLPLLERVVLEQTRRLQGKAIQLEIDVSPALRVDLPPGVLHILLSNLVGNAFSHCEPGPVHVAADAQGVQLQNRSTALPASLSERLGQPFQKGAASAGFGLGLAIVHRLAEHQGLKLVLSQADGNTRVQLLWATKAWLAPPASSTSA
jgi:signal transduction histidine kinase